MKIFTDMSKFKHYVRIGIYKALKRKNLYLGLFFCATLTFVTVFLVTKLNSASPNQLNSNESSQSNRFNELQISNDNKTDEKNVVQSVTKAMDKNVNPDPNQCTKSGFVSNDDLKGLNSNISSIESKPKDSVKLDIDLKKTKKFKNTKNKQIKKADKINIEDRETLSAANNSISETKEKSESKPDSFIMPVFGKVTFDFSIDKLVFSKTLNEWRTHSGVDISSDRGSPVRAVQDGIISEIRNSPSFGISVIIEHTSNFKTVYANLASDNMVSVNQIIKQGDVIGCIGNTANFESLEEPHLHFEVLKDSEPVNPKKYLKKLNE